MRLVKHSKTRLVFDERNYVGMLIGAGFLVMCGLPALGLLGATLLRFLSFTGGFPRAEAGDGNAPVWAVLLILMFFVAIGVVTLLFSTHTESQTFDKTRNVVTSESRRLIGSRIEEIPLSDIVDVRNQTTEDSENSTSYWVILKCSSGKEIAVNHLSGRDEATQVELADTMRAFLGLRPNSAD